MRKNRELLRKKYAELMPTLEKHFQCAVPDVDFYLWLRTLIDDQTFVCGLHEQDNLILLPGRYLAREHSGHNPGKNHLGLALVGSQQDCTDVAARLCRQINRLTG